MSRGFVAMMRGNDGPELIRGNPLAFALLATIAYRAQYRDGFNGQGLVLGEALIGDHENQGMSMRQYRTAKEQLSKWGFATFRTTNKGTIARLTDSRVFDVLRAHERQAERQSADEQQATTKNNSLSEEGKGREGSGLTPGHPSLGEVKDACLSMGMSEIEAETFFYEHQSIGWMLRGNQITDWIARLHVWQRRAESF